ncbi:MAG TPA: hypothetical protein VL119_02820 [Acidimicrobiia bacterium]|nr:hypothetical protein [Acidimicrobiia bacterium]
MRLSHLRALALAGVAAFALAACGSSSKSSSSSTATTTAPPATAAPATTASPATTAAPAATAATATTSLKVAMTKLGTVLVDSKGMTLYRFDGDTTPGQSNCGAGQCASTWPAATVTGKPTVGPGIDAALVTTFMRSDGMTQMQIAGHPLYTFAGDAKPGDTNGEGIIDMWYAAGPTGAKVGDNS